MLQTKQRRDCFVICNEYFSHIEIYSVFHCEMIFNCAVFHFWCEILSGDKTKKEI